MSWSVDRPLRAGGLVFVPIVDVLVSVQGNAARLAGHGAKQPAIILVFREAGVIGIDLNGHVYDADIIDLRYPKAIAMAVAQLAEDPPDTG